MLEYIVEKTNKYIEEMPKKERKKYGQFFTSIETARYMANMFVLPNQRTITVLDAGAGSGILACAMIERLNRMDGIDEILVTCYETDKNVLPLLKANLSYMQLKSTKKVNMTIITENYITSQYLEFNQMLGRNEKPVKYDIVIGNPPYMKIPKGAPEAVAMPEICYGAPNMYFLFAAMGLFDLKDNSEMVYIIPRSWTSGAYFKKFREYFLSEGKLLHVHLFGSRNKVFDKENVLQGDDYYKNQKDKNTTGKCISNINKYKP